MDTTDHTDAFRWIARNLAWTRRLDELRAAARPASIRTISAIASHAEARPEREDRVA